MNLVFCQEKCPQVTIPYSISHLSTPSSFFKKKKLGFSIISLIHFSLQWAEFVLFSCLLLVVCLIFSVMAYYYVPLKSEDTREATDKQIPAVQGNMINLETKNTRL